MSTNKKFRIQNGVNITGELSIDDITIIDANGNVSADAIASAVASLTAGDVADLQAQVTAILGSSPESLDTLQEIVAAFNAADSTLTGTIAANASAINTINNTLASGVATPADISGLDSDIGVLDTFVKGGASLSTVATNVVPAINELVTEVATVKSAQTGDTTTLTSAIATAKSEAISAASSDATTKADAAEAAANAYTDTEVAALVSSAPGALDTLNELAAALGDDASFASNVTASIATKADDAATTAALALKANASDVAASFAAEESARDSDVLAAIATAAADATVKADAAQLAAESTASADATSKADAAKVAANAYAVSVVSSTVDAEANTRAAADTALGSRVTAVEGYTTTDIPQGSNEYFTTAKARAAVQAGTGMSYNQSTGEFSTNLVGGDGVSVSGGTISIDGTSIGQDLVPSLDDTYSLGSPDKVWRDVYIGPGSLYINGTKILEDNSGTITMYADSGQNLSFGTTGGGVIDLNAGAESVQVKSNFILSSGKTITTVGGVPTQFGGDVELNGNCIFGLATPQTDGEAASKGYVDGLIAAGTIAGNKTFSNDVTIDGDLTVQGTVTTVNSETISLADNILDLNSNVTTGAPSENGGIRILRGDEAAAQIRWNETLDQWETFDGASYTKIAQSTSDLVEGSNEYFTDAKAKSAVASDIASAVTALDNDLQAQIHTLSSDASTEASTRAAADTTLQSNITAETTRATAAEGVNATAISSEASTRAAADTTLQSNIGAEQVARESADSDLQSQITTEVATRASAVSGLISDVASANAARISGDNNLQAAITSVQNAVNAITTGTIPALDTIVEVVAAFEAADGNLQTLMGDNSSAITVIDGRVDTLDSDMAVVQGLASATASTVSLHGGRLSTEESNVDALQSFTGTGTSLNTAAASLAAAINEIHGEVNTAVSSISTEVSRATTAEGVNATAIANEATARASADSDLQDSIDAEAVTRAAADTTLQSNINAEAVTRAAADTTLQSNINTEVALRVSGDSSLQDQINSIVSNTDPAALDSLTEIVAAFQSADGTLQGLVSSNNSSISTLNNKVAAIELWDTDNLSEGGNLYWTPERTKSVLTGGLCITYNSSTGEIKIDEAETASSLHVASSTDAFGLGGQAPSHYRIDIYDINGTVVN